MTGQVGGSAQHKDCDLIDDEQFNDEKAFLIKQITDLPPLAVQPQP